MKVPPRLRLAFYACVCYYVWIKDERAWAEGGKDEIDLDYENVVELETMGLVTLREATTGTRQGQTRVSTIRTEKAVIEAWKDTFTDEEFPTHPGFYGLGDWSVGENSHFETAPEGSVEGENGVFESDGELLISVKTPVDLLHNQYGEKLALHHYSPDKETTYWPRYRVGYRDAYGGRVTANASMLATLRCAVEDELYSRGHLYCKGIENRFSGTGRYGPVLDSGALYVMIRFGIIEVTQPYIEKVQSEGYGVTALGLEFYEKLKAVKDRLNNQKRYAEIGRAMGWED
jgi:hypothetical protein